MSFGVGIGDVVVVIQLCTETCRRLEIFSGTIKGPHYTISELEKAVAALRKAFGRLQQDDFNYLDENERNELGEITNVSIDLNNSIIRTIWLEEPPQLRALSRLWWRTSSEPRRPNTLLLLDMSRDIKEALRRLDLLLSQIWL